MNFKLVSFLHSDNITISLILHGDTECDDLKYSLSSFTLSSSLLCSRSCRRPH